MRMLTGLLRNGVMTGQLSLVIPPIAEPVTYAQAKLQVKENDDHQKSRIEDLIVSSRQWIEKFLNRAILSQSFRLFLNDFPCSDSIWLPMPPLQAVTHVKYFDTAGVQQTLVANTDYVVDLWHETEGKGRIYLPPDTDWPSVQADREKAIEIQFIAGWKGITAEATPASFAETGLPVAIAQGLLLDVQLKFEGEQLAPAEAEQLADARDSMLFPWRIIEIP